MSIILHFGVHKTGTTAVQRFAQTHRVALRARGLWYPSYALVGRNERLNHNDFAHGVAGESNRIMSPDTARRFVQEVRVGRRDGETVLISAEALSRHVIGKSSDYWERRDKFVEALRGFFADDDVTALMILRRQDSMAKSLHNEHVTVGGYTLGFDNLIGRERDRFDYLRHLEVLERHFKNVRVDTYEHLREGNLVANFFGLLGVDVSNLAMHEPVRVSLPLELVEFKRMLNGLPLKKREVKLIRERLEKLASARVAELRQDLDWQAFEESREFARSFEDDNERIRQRFARHLPAPLFPPPVPDGKAAFHGLSPERAIELATWVLTDRSLDPAEQSREAGAGGMSLLLRALVTIKRARKRLSD